jgi:hypothetical protein
MRIGFILSVFPKLPVQKQIFEKLPGRILYGPGGYSETVFAA